MKTLMIGIRTAAVALFLGWAVTATPAYLYPIQLGWVALGLTAFIAVQVRTTKNRVDTALAGIALASFLVVAAFPAAPLLLAANALVWGAA